jgi:hypothetical protein
MNIDTNIYKYEYRSDNLYYFLDQIMNKIDNFLSIYNSIIKKTPTCMMHWDHGLIFYCYYFFFAIRASPNPIIQVPFAISRGN